MLGARAFVVALSALAVSGAFLPVVRQERIVPPAENGAPFLRKIATTVVETDVSSIASLVTAVDSKIGPAVDEVPDQPVPETFVVAEKGRLTGARRGGSRRFRAPAPIAPSITKRSVDDYRNVFEGTGSRVDKDAAIEGSAYLTYTVVNNATYNVADCLNFCSRVNGCVFVNLYYEFNNYGLDFEVNEKSNLKCVAFAEVHTAAEKTNFGGQQSYPAPAPLTYITQSSGWALKSIADPETPEGYNLVYASSKANQAPAYLDFALIDKYDVDACARLCNEHEPSLEGGSCQYFNIFRASVNHIPKSYTCAMYYLPSDESTATYEGEGDLKVSFSRGYSRINFAFDGGFEAYAGCQGCFDESYDNWVATSPAEGYFDASIFHNARYARTGSKVALLGSAVGTDALPGTLSPAAPLSTVPGKKYQVSFWQNSAYSGPEFQKDAWFEVIWNGNVIQTFRPGFSDWSYIAVEVTATGSDTVSIRGGAAPAWTFIDDIAIWQL